MYMILLLECMRLHEIIRDRNSRFMAKKFSRFRGGARDRLEACAQVIRLGLGRMRICSVAILRHEANNEFVSKDFSWATILLTVCSRYV